MENTAKQNILDLNDAVIKLNKTLHQVTLNSFDIDTPEFFHLIDKQETPAEQIQEARKIIDLGAFVKSKVEMVMDTDFLESRVKDMTHGFQENMKLIQSELLNKVDENFDPAQNESYTARINRFFSDKSRDFKDAAEKSIAELIAQQKQVSEKLDSSFNPEKRSSYLSQVMQFVDTFKKDLEKQFDIKQVGSLTHELKEMLLMQFGKDGELLKTVEKRFSLDSSDSFASQVFKKLEEIKEEVKAGKSAADAAEQIVQKTTQKGYAFEDRLEAKLEELAALKGDMVENLSTQPGRITGSKKGDFLYTIKAIDKTIAIEAKSRSMGALKTVLTDMDLTKENRSADYVIYLTEKEDHLSKQVGLFQEYDEDKLITHFALLEIAIKVASSRLILENNEIEGIDRNAVEAELTSITNSLKSFTAIKTAANNIRKEADKILGQSGQINDDIKAALSKLNEIIFEN
ncbi:MAG: hypothetical protein H6627_04575 [Calditrichae bacterium]|nr:hypothetical protein [Calditrichia bacterium]